MKVLTYLIPDDLVVSANVIVGGDFEFEGIFLGGSQRCIVSENIIEGHSSGIRIFDVHHSSVIANVCRGNWTHGIEVTNSSHNVISNNVCEESSQATDDTSDGIHLKGDSDYNLITGNVCRQGAETNKPRYGINISADTCTENVVMGNDLYDSGKTANFNDAGTNTIVKDNRGYNPVGISSITVGGSPFTYTAGASPETVYVSGGTVSNITKDGNDFGITSGAFELEPYESIVVTYSAAPTMYKDVH